MLYFYYLYYFYILCMLKIYVQRFVCIRVPREKRACALIGSLYMNDEYIKMHAFLIDQF